MSSFQRMRSLRRPAPVSTEVSPDDDGAADPRNASPSRLPQFHSRNRSTVTSSQAPASAPKPRPTSSSLARSTSTKASASSNSTQEPSKRDAPRYPPSTTLTRQLPGHNRPGSSGNAGPTKRVMTHTRAKSTTASVNSSTVLRPPSRDQPTSSVRTTAIHRKNVSVDKNAHSSTVHTPTKSTAQAPQPRLRPAFSTLQQHYSPAKSLAPKPLTASYLAPPSPSKLPANVAASAETNRLQAELLQLHLLHRDAPAVEAAWRASARKKLGERYSRLDESNKEIAGLERERAEANNVLALRRWGDLDDTLDHKIQALDAIMNGVWALSEAGGRYARTVRRFERWVDRVSEIEEARRSGTAMLQGNDHVFTSELEAAWKEECPGLLRRLGGWQRQLKELGGSPQPPDDTGQPASVVRMLAGCDSLIRTMLAELAVMEDIEREALGREEEWIERVNREEDDTDTPKAGAIWRTV